MRQAEALLAAPGLDNPHGVPEYSRRLTDKILAAFNHAYSLGETEIAAALRDALEAAERRTPKGLQSERRGATAVQQADLWAAFVDARDAYNRQCDQSPMDAEAVKAAYAGMERAFRAWSYG